MKKNKYHCYEPFYPLAKEILKYLIPFRKLKKAGYPGYDEASKYKNWNKILDKMILAFELIIKDEENFISKNREKITKRIDEGLRLFGKFFQHLWD